MIMGKRCLAMVLYDPATAEKHRQPAAKRPRPLSPAGEEAGAVVPYAAAPPPAEDVQPINAVPARSLPAPQLSAVRFEPACQRKHLLPVLRLQGDLPVHFVAAKLVTGMDLDGHQSRFRIPTCGVARLRPLLTPAELLAANLLYDPEPRARPPKKQPAAAPADQSSSASTATGSSSEQPAVAGQQQKIKKKKKKKGREHGSLPVKLVDLAAGVSVELRLSRWESSHGTIVKGEAYHNFITQCSFKKEDVVEIWAFKQRAFCYFGVTFCEDSVLHLFVLKKENVPRTCRYCPLMRVK